MNSLFALKGTYPVIKEEEFLQTLEEVIVPKLDGLRKDFRIKRSDGHVIYGEIFKEHGKDAKGSIVISHGFTESCDKYREMIYYFLQEGYDVCIIEHRNHGRSRKEGAVQTRELATHVEHFQDYVDDLQVVVGKVILKELSGPYYLYAHSMGGAIGATYVQQHPSVFSKAIFTSPMFEINRGNLPYWLTKLVANGLCLIGKGKDFLPGQGCFSEEENFEASAATSKARYLGYFRRQLEEPLFQNNGSSCRWTKEALAADEKLLKEENCKNVNIPVLLFQAEKDDFVLPEGQEQFLKSIVDGRGIFVPESKHEVYLSPDRIMERYVQAIFDFLK